MSVLRGSRAFVVALVLVVAIACTDLQELFPELPQSDAAIVLALCKWLKGPSPSFFEADELANHLADIADCGSRLVGRYAAPAAPGPDYRAGASSTGTTVTEYYELTGKTKSGKLPKWRAPVPAPPGNAKYRSIEASATFTDEDYVDAKKTPKKLQVTLYDVNGNGKRSKIARRTAAIRGAVASTVFGALEAPADHYEVEFKIKGGAANPGLLLYTAGARAAGAPSVSAPREPRRWRRPEPRATAESNGLLVFDSYDVAGPVGAGALPKVTIDLASTNTSASGGGRTVLAGLLALDARYQASSGGPTRIDATLYDVDRNGKRSKLRTASGTLDDGGAQVQFTGLSAPKDHFQVDIVASGGSAATGVLAYLAADGGGGSGRVWERLLALRTATDPGAASRARRQGPGR